MEINDYSEAAEIFGTVRTPSMGKPLKVGNMRLFQNVDRSFRFTLNDREFARLDPDDVLTFTIDEKVLRDTIGSNLVYIMGRLLPVHMHRMSGGRYRVGPRCHYNQVRYLPEYFCGIKFAISLTDVVCLNRKPDRAERVDKEARKVWLATSAEYRKGVYSRLKLGMRGDKGKYLGFDANDLARWMRSGEYTDSVFCHIALNAHNDTYEAQKKAYDKLIDFYRSELRQIFGVYLND